MAFPPQYREPAPALPSIIVPHADHRFRGHPDIPYSRSAAMSIPGIEPRDEVPPPLPPPRILPLDGAPTAPHPEDMRDRGDYATSAASYTSGYGSLASSFVDERPSYKRRDTNSTQG